MKQNSNDPMQDSVLIHFPKSSRKFLQLRGKEVIEKLGEDSVREVVFNVLCGKNLRDSTEVMTRRRLSKISAALLIMLMRGCKSDPDFLKTLPMKAEKELRVIRNKEDRWILEWILGLTDKGFQNILRDNSEEQLSIYARTYSKELAEIINACKSEYGDLRGKLEIGEGTKIDLNWDFFVQQMGLIGAQTLALRGSEKSTYGKLFEKLILGSALSILGFKFTPDRKPGKNIFWLSTSNEKRESDALVLMEEGKGAVFDIGFIGRGNPEISLDKVTRFDKEQIFSRKRYDVATFIIVDRIGERSKLEELAGSINGSIVQMSLSLWLRDLSVKLRKQTGYRSKIETMSDEELISYIRKELKNIRLADFI